eukprot:2630312-Pyramimonas_sp.AAC.1
MFSSRSVFGSKLSRMNPAASLFSSRVFRSNARGAVSTVITSAGGLSHGLTTGAVKKTQRSR